MYKFAAASKQEITIFGSAKPGFSEQNVRDWLKFMQRQKIESVCCLLPKKQLAPYSDLLGTYEKEFGHQRVCWTPIEDFTLPDIETLTGKILPFLVAADQQSEKVVVHCGGGFSTKVHVKAEGFGKPMHFVLTSGERHDTVACSVLLKGGKVKCLGRGRPKHRSRYLVGDKAYNSQEIRQQLPQSGTTPVISTRSNQKRRGRFNRGLYRERNRVERLINRLKQYRRIATRYEKYAVNYLAMLMIGAIRLWL